MAGSPCFHGTDLLGLERTTACVVMGVGRTPAPGSKLVSALTALEEPSGRFDPRPGDSVGVCSGPGDLQRRHLFGQDLEVDTARGCRKPTAGQED